VEVGTNMMRDTEKELRSIKMDHDRTENGSKTKYMEKGQCYSQTVTSRTETKWTIWQRGRVRKHTVMEQNI